MLENSNNRKDESEEEIQQASHNNSENDNSSQKWDWVKIKEYALSIGKMVWEFIKGYLVIVKEWFTGKRSSRTDRFAMALCLVFAISVWLYVMSNNDTEFEKELSGVDINIEGVSALGAENMSILNGYDQTVKVTLEGKRAEIGSLTADDLYMYVDVSQIKTSGRHTLQVMLDLPKGSSLVSIEPSHISLDVDVNSVKTVDVDVKMSYRNDPKHTLSINPSYSSVIVSGPASILDTVSYAAVNFGDLGLINSSLTMVGELALYDDYGLKISNPYVKCTQSQINVVVKVTATKKVDLHIQFENGISQPYKSTLTPSWIEITGDPTMLNTIDSLVVYTVKDGEIEVGHPMLINITKFDLPEGVSITGDPAVSVYIERVY